VVICRGTVEEMPALAVAQRSLQNILVRAELLPRDHEAPGPGGPVSTGWTMPHADDDAEEHTPAAPRPEPEPESPVKKEPAP
jgi:hypothetical protein